MNAALRTFLASFVFPAAVATGSALLTFHFLWQNELIRRADDEMSWVEDAARLLHDRYYEDVSVEQLAYDAIRGMVRRDRYSEFVDPEMEARFREENDGQYVGIGFVVHPAAEPVTVLYPFPGSPSARAGLDTGDRIIGVDGLDTTGLSEVEIVDRIKLRNGEGTTVRLRVQPYTPPGDPPAPVREVDVRRETIWRPSVVDPRLLDAEQGIAYVRVKQFQEHTDDELTQALEGLVGAGMKALVLDLRGNRGGYLDQAIEMVSLFLDDGVVVRTEGRSQDSTRVYETAKRPAPYRGMPLVLLVDDDSASASEVVAGALQDHMRALLVGDRTFGKGMVQSVIPQRYIVDGEERYARIKITTSRYFTPAGRAIETWPPPEERSDDAPRSGLHPDVYVPLRSADEESWLARYLADREIDEETWRKIATRCPERTRVVESADGLHDRQLDAALSVLAGEKVFEPIQPESGEL